MKKENSPLKISSFLKAIVTAALVFLLLRRVGLRNIKEVFTETGPFAFISGFLLFMVALFFQVTTYKKLLQWAGEIRLKPAELYLDISRINAFSAFTPARAGHLLIIKLLNKRGVAMGTASAVFFAGKMLNYITLLFLSFAGAFIILEKGNYAWLTLFFILLLGAAVFLIVNRTARKRIKNLLGEKIKAKFKGFLVSLKKITENKNNIPKLFLLKLSERFFVAAVIFIIFIQQQEIISLITVLLLTSIASVISALPITIGGFGVREGSAVLLFSFVGVSAETVISAYLFYFVIKYVSVSIPLVFLTGRYGV